MRALDLFCGGGGAAEGLIEAGFNEVVGIDINKHPNYPGDFILGDVFKTDFNISDFDFIWASPPCQKFSRVVKKQYRDNHPDYINDTRNLIKDHPYTCIENVPQAPIRADLILTGPMVGLNNILRKRHFECSFNIIQIEPIIKRAVKTYAEGFVTVTGTLGTGAMYYKRREAGLHGVASLEEAKKAMGVTISMTVKELVESVPPAYSTYIGKQVIESIFNASN